MCTILQILRELLYGPYLSFCSYQVSYDTEGTCQLVIQRTEQEHFGHYYVEAKNRYGVDVTHAELVQIGTLN